MDILVVTFLVMPCSKNNRNGSPLLDRITLTFGCAKSRDETFPFLWCGYLQSPHLQGFLSRCHPSRFHNHNAIIGRTRSVSLWHGRTDGDTILWIDMASVIGFSETNLGWKHSWATNLVFQIFRRQWTRIGGSLSKNRIT
jgi:hypothetical protein